MIIWRKFFFYLANLLKLKLIYCGPLPAAFFSFIDIHPSIQDFRLIVGSLSVMHLSKIAKSLPSLEPIHFGECKISANEEISDFMSEFRNLNSFSFKVNDTIVYNDFKRQLHNE